MIEWRQIPGFTEYEVSNAGQVRRGGRLRKLATHPNGYKRISPYRDGYESGHWVHRLVASAFIGPCGENIEVNHKDGDRGNNRVDNLEYVTRNGNARDRVRRSTQRLAGDVARWREREAENG